MICPFCFYDHDDEDDECSEDEGFYSDPVEDMSWFYDHIDDEWLDYQTVTDAPQDQTNRG